MYKKAEDFFLKSGSDALLKIERAVSDFHMKSKIFSGTLLGLSGGADSVMLLLYLVYLRSKRDFPLAAVHVNHLIRGEEAERDERFSERLCHALGVEFQAVRVDVPHLAREQGKGVEEAARDARYSCFDEIISARSDINYICVAHNADDNFETVVMNMMRGAGLNGLTGIAPVRDNILRPLIYLKKKEITEALEAGGFEFVTDSTNESDDYTRNYIRHNVIPSLERVFDAPVDRISRMCQNLREDDGCLASMAAEFASRYENGKIPTQKLAGLKPAILYRVLGIYAKEAGAPSFERVHFEAMRRCVLKGGSFSVSLPGSCFRAMSGMAGFYKDKQIQKERFSFPLSYGINKIGERGAVIEIVKNKAEFSTKVYNKSTQRELTSAIILGGLLVRSKQEGDTCFYGGMTRKLKKLFNDKKIPADRRADVPVLCDEKGVVWVPGFDVRDDGGEEKLYIRISMTDDTEDTFYLPENREVSNKKGKKVT